MNNQSTPQHPETAGLTQLGEATHYTYNQPSANILEAFPNKNPQRDYTITFEHHEFSSVCPMTGQPDFADITIRYVPDQRCVESKSFKLYMVAYRNYGSFMEAITNKIADDLIEVLAPRRLQVIAAFKVRGGTSITVEVDYLNEKYSEHDKVARLW